MKTLKILGIGFLVFLGLLVIVTGVVFAASVGHNLPPFDPQNDEEVDAFSDVWFMHGSGWHWEDPESGAPPIREGMLGAISKTTGLELDEIIRLINEGEHLFSIATSAGMDEEEFFELMFSIHSNFFKDVDVYTWSTRRQHHRQDGTPGEYSYPECQEGSYFTPPMFENSNLPWENHGRWQVQQ